MSKKQLLGKAKKNDKQALLSGTEIMLPGKADAGKLKLIIIFSAIIFLFAFLLYAQTLWYSYTLDDASVIGQNKLVKKGLTAIPELLRTDYWYGYTDKLRGQQYRPASLVMFAAEQEFFPGDPHAGHFMNVFLYAFTCAILFILLAQLFNKQNLLLPFICTVLFVAHPIHTEVVSNIKSRDEILCFLFGIATVFLILKYNSNKNILFLLLGGIFTFLSLVSKETGIAFILIGPLLLYVCRDVKSKTLLIVFLTLTAFAGLYLFIRYLVVKDVSSMSLLLIDNTLIAATNNADKLATEFYILLRYVGLLLFPHPLSYDYSFSQIKIISLADPKAILAIILYFFMGTYAFIKIRQKSLYALAILLFLLPLAPVSNIFLKIGSTMAERFLYMPSLGFCLFISLVLVKIMKANVFQFKLNSPLLFLKTYAGSSLIVLLITCIYSFKTIARNQNWTDNIHLFGNDVNSSANSARTHYNQGLVYVYDLYLKQEDPALRKQFLEDGKKELQNALEIYPEYFEAEKPLGYVFLKQGDYKNALPHFNQYLLINPTDVSTLNNKAAALIGLQDYAAAIPVLQMAIQEEPTDTAAVKNLGRCFAYNNQFEKAAVLFLKSIELAPAVADNYRLAGMAYQFMGDSSRAKPFLEKALAMDKK